MKKLLKWLSGIALIFTLAWLLLNYWSAAVLQRACEDWPLMDTSLVNMSQVFPVTSGDQLALGLQGLYEQIDFKKSKVFDKKGTKTGQREFEGAPDREGDIKNYLHTELAKPLAAIGLPSAQIRRVLLENKDILGEISHLLVSEDLPVFPLDVEIGPLDLIPDRSWPLRLNRSLVVHALVLSQVNNETDKAWLVLHAASRLADSFFVQPFLLSQMIAIKEAENILLAMRKMTAPAPHWAMDWPGNDIANGMLLAFAGDARVMVTMAEKSELASLAEGINEMSETLGIAPVEIGLGTRFLYVFVGRQCLRVFASYWIAATKKMIQQRLQEGLCVETPSQLSALKKPIPSWLPGNNHLLDLLYPGDMGGFYNKCWFSLYRIFIYKTGTQAVLHGKAVKAATAGSMWPREMPVNLSSCAAHSWNYTVVSDDSVVYEYGKTLPQIYEWKPLPSGFVKYIGGAGE